MRARTARPLRALGVASLAALLAAGCDTATRTSSAPTTSGVSSTSTPPTTSPTSASGSSSTSTSSTPSSTTTTPAPSCGQRLASKLTPAQRAGQLLMVGLQPTGSSSRLAAQVKSQHLGGVIYLGGWSGGTASMARISARLQQGAGGSLLIAADQEGGQVQQLKGPGFTRMPSARTQGQGGPRTEEANVAAWSRELAKAGVTINLAPVADTVPTSLGAANQPIGRYRRDFVPGSSQGNATYVAAFVRGSLAADVIPTVKHFPGLGRITGNTDVTTAGTTDATTDAGDSYLAPFTAGIKAGAPVVMVSSARYPRLDPDNRAMFSRGVISGLLRGKLGFDGVVITDDVGAAKAVAAVPVGDRATRFLAAGGDIVLTARSDQAGTMLKAIARKRAASPAFATQVDAAAARVLDLKADSGLVSCD
ncbi:glycoside hydrolase family 3 N-terminal domain-containing protein [Phycicoccus sp. Root563]|uniref:glycoside hydrolase family 3 N-terminal domain-containing protein n=1 Tax=Phycicoccus sp. Root563 TaxID=1736562 RepID=UPI0009EBEDCF|nr:glycoside hydrolase family 3 N-terminal domain-containing protein [Phycicoccus sp. Root563]